MRTLYVGALALTLVGCTTGLPNLDPTAAQIRSKRVATKVHSQNVTKLTKPQTRTSAQWGKSKAAGKYNVDEKNTPSRSGQLNATVGTAESAIEKAKATIAAMMADPESAEFYNLKRAVRKLVDESVDSICGYVKGKNGFGGDTGEMAFLYIIRDDREGEAYLVDGTSYAAQTVHSVLCK
jgi:hypothetical protein